MNMLQARIIGSCKWRDIKFSSICFLLISCLYFIFFGLLFLTLSGFCKILLAMKGNSVMGLHVGNYSHAHNNSFLKLKLSETIVLPAKEKETGNFEVSI